MCVYLLRSMLWEVPRYSIVGGWAHRRIDSLAFAPASLIYDGCKMLMLMLMNDDFSDLDTSRRGNMRCMDGCIMK